MPHEVKMRKHEHSSAYGMAKKEKVRMKQNKCIIKLKAKTRDIP